MIFTQIDQLFQIPQRYRFSSKSQRSIVSILHCCVVLDTTKVQIFKQITTADFTFSMKFLLFQIPQRYRFSSKSQQKSFIKDFLSVVLDTTKVQIFKQITTLIDGSVSSLELFQIPQRYRFSSKSQLQALICLMTLVVIDTTKVYIVYTHNAETC